MSRAVDAFVAYRVLKLLVTPFKKTKAYQMGIIDDKGKVLIKSKDIPKKFPTYEIQKARRAYTLLIRFVFNLKRLLSKVGIRGPIGSAAAAAIAFLKEEYPNNQYIVVPDPAGKARSTNARRSDHQILRDEGLDVRSDRRHPPVVDRVNTVNKRLESIAIHPKCKSLIRDFEQVVNKDGTREIDKSNSKLTHMTDAFGYSLVRFYPLQQVNVRAMQR